MIWLVALLAAGACSCAGADGMDPDVAAIKTRAAFELNCPEDQVRGRWLDEKTMGVTACGQRATYVKMCRKLGLRHRGRALGGVSVAPERPVPACQPSAVAARRVS